MSSNRAGMADYMKLVTGWYAGISDMADAAIQTSYEACDGRDGKLKEALLGLINITNENQTRLQQLRGEHDTLRWVGELLHYSGWGR